MYSRKPFTLDSVVRLVIALAIIAGIFWLITILKGVLLPFLVACLIAYMFEPLVQMNRQTLHLRGRGVAVFITLFEAITIFALICWFLVPLLFDEMHRMANVLRNYAATNAQIKFLPEQLHYFLRKNVDFNKLSKVLMQQEWSAVIESTLSTAWGIITGSISIIIDVVSWLVVAIYLVFVMIDYDKLGRGFRHMVPPRYRDIVLSVAHDVKVSMNRYFRGQALVAFLVGVLFSIGFYFIGLPMAVVLGLFIGLLNLVPYLQLISIIPTTLLCLVYAVGGGGDFWVIFGECMVVYAVVQVIQDMFLVPKIMGKAMGLNPALILLSLSVWGTLLGLVGLIIALPLTTLLLSYYNRYVIAPADEASVEAMETFPDEPDQLD